jgi:1-acyl-sn-glycerol-3-phosphate acyltransferase
MLDPTYENTSSVHAEPRRFQAPRLRLVDQPKPELPAILAKRDPELVRRFYPLLTWLVDRYYRTEVQGAENLSDKACLMVATHNGGIFTPDAYGLAVAFWRRFGLETPAYGMAHRMVFAIPGFGEMLEKLGAIHASRQNAELALRAGCPIFVCPGGDIDNLKPFSQRHRIFFGGRRGFIRMAIREQAPIIPVVSVGAHEVMFILNDGRRLAKLAGFTRFRIKTCPFALTFPFGITPAGLFSLPLPSKVVLRILPKIELSERPEAADDPAIVERCTTHVRSAMQTAVTDLASKRRFPVLG